MMEEEKNKSSFFWQDPAIVTSDHANLEQGRNLIFSIIGNDLFLNSTIQNIAQSYNIDACTIDFIDLLKSSRQSFSTWSDKFLLANKSKGCGLLILRNTELLDGNKLSDLSELDILFRLTDKSSPYSDLITLLTFKVDDLSILQTSSHIGGSGDDNSAVEENTVVPKEFDWKAYLTSKWSPSHDEFNPTALIGRMSRAAVQISNEPLPCPTQSKSVQDTQSQHDTNIIHTTCEVRSSADPKCQHSNLLRDTLKHTMSNIGKQVDKSLITLTGYTKLFRLTMLSSLGQITVGSKTVKQGDAHAMQATDAFALLGVLLLAVLLLRRVLVGGTKKKRVTIILPSDGIDLSNQNTQTHPTSALKKPKPTLTPGPNKGKKVGFQGDATESVPEHAEKAPVKGRIQRVQTPAAKGPKVAATPSPSSSTKTAGSASKSPVDDVATSKRTNSTRSRSPTTPLTRTRTRGKATPAKSDDFIYN